MTDFKVGDRVRVYGHKALDWETTDARVIERGVDELIHAEFIMVLANNGLRVLVHPKQCRRLVKKYRRRVWIIKRENDSPQVVHYAGFIGSVNYGESEFIEVKRK